LFGGLAALLADSLTGPSLRSARRAAIFFTLLGALWAAWRDGRPDRRSRRAATAGLGRRAAPISPHAGRSLRVCFAWPRRAAQAG